MVNNITIPVLNIVADAFLKNYHVSFLTMIFKAVQYYLQCFVLSLPYAPAGADACLLCFTPALQRAMLCSVALPGAPSETVESRADQIAAPDRKGGAGSEYLHL